MSGEDDEPFLTLSDQTEGDSIEMLHLQERCIFHEYLYVDEKLLLYWIIL